MRPHLREFLELCARTLPCPEPIVEIGAFQVAGQEAIADLRPLFPGKTYIGCDMQPGPGVDRIEDIHQLSFRSNEIGTFILADTLEHVADPIRAMREIYRCLREDGIVVYSSVMHFPIHGYPNDYWRFTPEAFRALGADFPCLAIFYCGSPEFPHTVCGIGAKNPQDAAAIRVLAGRMGDMKKTAPLIIEGRAARIIQRLVMKLLPSPGTAPPKQTFAGFDRLALPNWSLVTGQWLSGWAAVENVTEVEVLAGDTIIHRARLNRPRPEIAARLKLPENNALIGFSDQLDLSHIGDVAGVLHMRAMNGDGQGRMICESAPGLLLGSIKLETEFVMHSFDERAVETMQAKGRQLIDAIRQRNETVDLDLGCGFRKKGNLGIDVTAEGTQADLVCRLGFESIPLPDEAVDSVFCRDFLEHIPKAYYSEGDKKLRYPIIELINEIWRVLKPGGTFTSFTPCYPATEVHRDPTHLSVWTLESMDYFCGKYPVAQTYGVRAKFELVENRLEEFYLHAVLRKPKPTHESS
ncbi:MAG: class I SAM-dependent methyltransferase [Verrucomicrobiota bacterium]